MTEGKQTKEVSIDRWNMIGMSKHNILGIHFKLFLYFLWFTIEESFQIDFLIMIFVNVETNNSVPCLTMS